MSSAYAKSYGRRRGVVWPASIDALDPVFVLGSLAATPTGRYKGKDATNSTFPAWTYGEDLSVVAGSVDCTLNQGSALKGTNDDSIKYNGANTKHHKAANNTFGNAPTNDLIVEAVVHAQNLGASQQIISKSNPATGVGWWFYIESNSLPQFGVRSAGPVVATAAAVTTGDWFHLVGAYRYGDATGLRLWSNGVGGTVVDASAVGSKGNTSYALTMGAHADGSAPCNSAVSYVAFYALAQGALPAGLAGIDAWVINRFRMLAGIGG